MSEFCCVEKHFGICFLLCDYSLNQSDFFFSACLELWENHWISLFQTIMELIHIADGNAN